MITEILIYLLKSSLVLASGYLFYHLLLRKHTHFQLNRWVLLLQIGLVLLLPAVQLPQAWHPFAQEFSVVPLPIKPTNPPANQKELSEADSLPHITSTPSSAFNPYFLLVGMYGMGLLFFSARLLLQFLSLIKLERQAVRFEDHPEYRLVWCRDPIGPFSFFKQIFLSKQGLDAEAVSQIIRHEKIHIQQKHSYDILLTETLIVLLWFNPFAWLYKRAVETNLEFLTDQVMLEAGVLKKNYMYQLLAISLPEWKGRLGTRYNQSLLQKRITMMNTKRSSKRARWSYLTWLVAMPLFSFFNAPVIPDFEINQAQDKPIDLAIIITEDATPEELEQLKQEFAELKHNQELTIDNLEYDFDNKITSIAAGFRSGEDYITGTAYIKNPFNSFDSNVPFIPMFMSFKGRKLYSTRGLREVALEQIIKNYDEMTILAAGLETNKAALEAYYPQLESSLQRIKREAILKLEKNGWKKKSGVVAIHTDIDESIWSKIELFNNQFDAQEKWFIVDGGEKQDEIPRIPLDKIQEIKVDQIVVQHYKPHTLKVINRIPKEVLVYIQTKF